MRTSFLFSGALVAATTVFAATSPAFAYNIAPDGSVIGINSSDIGDIFQVNFNGSVNEQDVENLTGRAQFQLNSLGQQNIGGTNYTIANFFVNLTNTSSNPIESRISRIGFDTDPDIVTLASTVNGTFNVVESGSFPNQVGAVEVCLVPGTQGNCTGGPGGVETGETGTFNLSLAFAENVDSFNMNNFHLRYQSIDGTDFGTSGTGDGTIVGSSSVDAPEPLTILGTGMAAGFGAIFRKEKQKKSKQKAKIEA